MNRITVIGGVALFLSALPRVECMGQVSTRDGEKYVANNDTTAFMRRLLALGTDVKKIPSSAYKEKYVMRVRQNVNGNDSSKGTFEQRVVVGLKGEDRPTVLVTEGYFGNYALNPGYEEELCQLFDANLVFCEYRYFAESVPEPLNWKYMTVDNSLHDYHHVRSLFAPIFRGKWISTGISKGGQTTMFYRATYPNDVDISVSYVAPLNRGVEDGRHERFLAKQVGTKAERKKILRAEQELMIRKQRLLSRFEQFAQEHNYHYNASAADIYDYCVMELPFALWQWGTPISTIPDLAASDSTWFDYFVSTAEPNYFNCPSEFTPFFVQASRELGYYGYSRKGLKQWQSIKTAKGYMRRLLLPEELRNTTFDKTLYKRTVKYLKENDPKHIFIYGSIDPWTASGVAGWLDCSRKQNMRVYVQPGGSHRSRIGNMPSEMKQKIIDRLTKWLKE